MKKLIDLSENLSSACRPNRSNRRSLKMIWIEEYISVIVRKRKEIGYKKEDRQENNVNIGIVVPFVYV